MNYEKSTAAFAKAKEVIPGGVNSPVRAFKSVGINPVIIESAKGCRIKDIDGNEYIDFVSSWGPLILGHANETILEAITKTAQKGTSFGAPTLLETEMAELIVKMVPSVEKVRMVNSGTEATMSALRLARGYTQRSKIIKFAGNYHGHADSFLIKAGSGAITLGLPDSPGVTAAIAQDTLVATYNDLASVEKLFVEQGDDIAAVIVEPVAGNMGVVPPAKGFLEGLRKLTTEYGAVLIFDEVITGFRLAKGGAQEYFGVTPDLTTLGKIIGGGLPVGAYGGKKEIMDMLAPNGPVYQAGTLSGNPLAMAAGLAMLKTLNETPGFYEELERKAKRLEEGLKANLEKTGVKGIINRVGSLMTLFFTESAQVTSFDEAMTSDTKKYADYFKTSLDSGIYQAPSQFEAMFISQAHTDEDIDRCIAASLEAMKKLV
ncbi:glutamate-1-semialdehyde 2,1-aminomutase [Paludibacter jiangxiensis]|uniref:Glutamate-1-semialdehyde 2,1-aminomutase n=1 Tax=Paludibacter jiangxiensis TaxID=681398 RepID=A0A161LCV5_9BACT|nr:glutamate-1-semialdehyde 2,1-aminomutase [Paludibacter jiangxiensis]GAT61567.1 glutamate-1-semialdehyde 2,1-aminomutase [Paludibacter jiangxiensis]